MAEKKETKTKAKEIAEKAKEATDKLMTKPETTDKPASIDQPAASTIDATTSAADKPAKSDDFSSGFTSGFEAKKRGKPVKQNVTDPDELSIDFEEDGKVVRKGLKKEVLSKGAWVTVAYLFQDLNRKKEIWGPPKCSITRYKKAKGIYQFQKEFTLSSAVQAKQFVDAVQKWLTDGSLPVGAETEEEA
jgi:hypothetical protein